MKTILKNGHKLSHESVVNMPRIATDTQLAKELTCLLKIHTLGNVSFYTGRFKIYRDLFVLHPDYARVAADGVQEIETCSRTNEVSKPVRYVVVTGVNGLKAQFDASDLRGVADHERKLVQLACNELGGPKEKRVRLFDHWLAVKGVSIFDMRPTDDHIEFTWPDNTLNKLSWEAYIAKTKTGWLPKFWKFAWDDEDDY